MGKDKQERAKSWFVVFNNPDNHMKELNHLDEQGKCKYLSDKWIKENGDNCACAFVYCISADGLHHIHCVVENPNKVSFNKVRAFFNNSAHLSMTRGTKKQAEDYIYKRGAFEEKGEKIIASFVHGEIAGAQGQRTDLTTAYDIIMNGGTKGDVYLDNPNMARYHGALDDLIKNREDTLYGNMIIEDRQVMFIQGGFGVGKTESIYREHGVKNVHSTDNYSFPGDGYNHQEVTLFDEFYSSFEMSLMLKLLQGKPFKMNVKGSYIYNTSKYIYMTSNSNIEEQYKNIKEDNPERWGAFIRRIDILRDYTDFLKFTDYRVVNVESEERDKQGRKIQKYDFVNDEKTLSYFGHNWAYTETKQGKYDVIKYINPNVQSETVEPPKTEEQEPDSADLEALAADINF